MALAGSLQLPYDVGLKRNKSCFRQCKRPTSRGNLHLFGPSLSLRISLQHQDPLRTRLSENVYRSICYKPDRWNTLQCKCFLSPAASAGVSGIKSVGTSLTRSYNALQGNPAVIKVVSAVGIIAFALWGIGPLLKKSRNFLSHKSDGNWKKSNTYFVLTSYLQPLLLWSGALLLCRAVDPVILPTDASQVVKQRLLNFLRSLSTVLTFAYCLSGVIQQAQKFFMETSDPTDARNMGFQFAGKAVYSAVWVAAVSLFMELLGFSTQRWLTAGGLGTVLLTLAGREIFTNFLSSMMIHATRPFVLNEWIQTKIEGYDVSGHVEHVGWWSPTVIRGEDGEAVHIPNHKFTVNVVRNLSQKTHWRIKTHLAISHLDVSKINNIIADMRKVLAKNPQVEQQKLHRRVFLDYIEPENQAQMILISCFVKTPHIQEYLCVKEAVLLDLLRVIKHHRARLATPIRTVQKIYNDADVENAPFSDASFSHGGVTSRRPLLLIEPPYKINGEDKNKTRSGRTTAEQDGKTALKTGPDSKLDAKVVSESKVGDKVAPHSKTDVKVGEEPKNEKEHVTAASNSDLRLGKSSTMKSSAAPRTGNKPQETLASESKMSGLNSDSSTQKVVEDKQPNKVSSGDSQQVSKPVNLPESSREAGSIKPVTTHSTSSSKQQNEKISAGQPAISKSSLEENIVLGVALQGSKRTLPIEEDLPVTPSKEEEVHAPGNGNGSPTAETDQRDG